VVQAGQLIIDSLGLDELQAVELIFLDYGRGDLRELGRGILQYVQEL